MTYSLWMAPLKSYLLQVLKKMILKIWDLRTKQNKTCFLWTRPFSQPEEPWDILIFMGHIDAQSFQNHSENAPPTYWDILHAYLWLNKQTNNLLQFIKKTISKIRDLRTKQNKTCLLWTRPFSQPEEPWDILIFMGHIDAQSFQNHSENAPPTNGDILHAHLWLNYHS